MGRPIPFAVRRVIHGVGMYLALVLAITMAFQQVADQSLRAQADEEVLQILKSAGSLDAQSYTALREQTMLAKAAQYHLDEPWVARVLWQAGRVLTFQLGQAATLKTASGDRDVWALIAEALPPTLALFVSEAVLVLILGAAAGLWAGHQRGKALDRTLAVLPTVAGGLPAWWVGMLGLMAFAYALPLFPSGGIHANPVPTGVAGLLDALWHMALPLGLLVLLNVGPVAWQVRNLVAGALNSGPLVAARAKGLSEARIVFVHVVAFIRPALVTLTVLGLLQSLSGNLLIEGIFQWSGLGSLTFAAVQQSDTAVLVGIVSLQTLLNLAALVALDLIYRVLDPRLKTEGPR